VIFDLDDTLIGEVEVAMGRLAASAAQVGGSEVDGLLWRSIVLEEARLRWRASPWSDLFRELGFASWEGLWSDGEQNHSRLDGLSDWLPEYRRSTWATALEKVEGPKECGPVVEEWFVEAQRSGHPLLPGAPEAVAAAGAGRMVALLTNGPADIQRHKLGQTGLASAFDSVVVSGELGQGKPASASFLAVTEEMGSTPERTVMVGDSWERDVLGALDAGLAGAVWLAHGRVPPGPVPGRTIVMEDLSEGLGFLG
jgi:putative hydrolase of the HAD superfamily